MSITISDLAKYRRGGKDATTGEDFYGVGLDIMGGCQVCHATLAAYNGYPTKSGYWRCKDCLADVGYENAYIASEDIFGANREIWNELKDELRQYDMFIEHNPECYDHFVVYGFDCTKDEIKGLWKQDGYYRMLFRNGALHIYNDNPEEQEIIDQELIEIQFCPSSDSPSKKKRIFLPKNARAASSILYAGW
jgi:hypothetical protein